MDIDPRNGGWEALAELEGKHGPITSEVIATTQGGGEHRVFLAVDGVSYPSQIGPGLDIKHHGYICVEPTGGESGLYKWQAGKNPIQGAVPSPAHPALHGEEHAAHVTDLAYEVVTRGQLEDLRDALRYLDSDNRNLYINQVGMALKTVPLDAAKDIWLEWSARSPKFCAATALIDWDSLHPTATHWRNVFKLASAAGWKNGQSSSGQQPDEPTDIFELADPGNFHPRSCLPSTLADWVEAHEAVSGLEAVSFAFSTLPVLAASTDRSVRIDLGSGHQSPLILWAALVGATGSGKSPAMNAAHLPLSRLSAEEIRLDLKRVEGIGGAKSANRVEKTPVLETVRYVTDTTPEALIAILSQSRGARTLVHHDEGSGWLNDMGRYSSGADSARSTYLSAWLGQRDQLVLRIGRGATLVPELGVSMLYGITPNKIKEGSKEASSEGLLGRTLLCLIDRKRHKPSHHPSVERMTEADAAYARLVIDLTRLRDVEIRFSSEAQHTYDAERMRFGETAAKLENSHPGMAAMLAKAADNLGRIAALFMLCVRRHEVEAGQSSKHESQINGEDLALAVNFMQVAVSHAHAAYTGLLITDEPTTIARQCALKILRLGLRKRGISEITRQDFMKVPGFLAADRPTQSASLELLNIHNWLLENRTQRNRGNSARFGEGTRWEINPLVFDGRFGQMANESLAAADEVHRMLLELGGKAKG